jgi:carboxylesterase
MRPLGDALAARGFPVRAPCLAGHGTSVADLATTTAADWLASADAGLAGLRAEVPRVAVVGLSMGGLLAALVAAARPADVAALVLCAPALRLADWRPRLLPWLVRVPGVRRRLELLPKRGGRDLADPAARARSVAYDAIPVASVVELLRLQRRVRRTLPAVRQPALLLHGRLDATVPVASQATLRRALGSRDVEHHVLERSAHVVTEDVERATVARLVVDFVERVARREEMA